MDRPSHYDGDVKFEMKDFSGVRKIIAQTNSQKDRAQHDKDP
jgi:hypothetical protein